MDIRHYRYRVGQSIKLCRPVTGATSVEHLVVNICAEIVKCNGEHITACDHPAGTQSEHQALVALYNKFRNHQHRYRKRSHGDLVWYPILDSWYSVTSFFETMSTASIHAFSYASPSPRRTYQEVSIGGMSGVLVGLQQNESSA